MQGTKSYDVCKHRYTGEIRLMSKSEQRNNRNFDVISYRILTVEQLTELLAEVLPRRYNTYVSMCIEKYDTETANRKIYESAVTGELRL